MGRGVVALSFAPYYESSFSVPSDCYTMTQHHVLCHSVERASHVRKWPRCNEAPPQSLWVLIFVNGIGYLKCILVERS
jgi:hypothetical protein